MKQKFTLRRAIAILLSATFALSFQSATAQVAGPNDCAKKLVCTSNDVQIITSYLSDKQGERLPPNFVCGASGTAEVYLTLELTTNTPRVGVAIFTNVKAFTPPATFGNTVASISQCFDKALNQPTNKVTFSQPFNWSCGQAIVLTDVFIAWGTGGSQFCTGTSFQCPGTGSKCFSLPPNNYIPIVTPTPPQINEKVCATEPGGNTATFNLTAKEGAVVNNQNAVVTGWYSNAALTEAIVTPGSYTTETKIVYAKLCALNGGQITNACVASPVSLTVHQRPQLSITNPAAVCSPSTVDLTTGSVTAGSILPANTTLLYFDNQAIPQTIQTPTAAGAGTYNIVATTAYGEVSCSHTQPVTVTVKAKPAAPTAIVSNNCDGTSTLSVQNPAANASYVWSPGGATSNPLTVSMAGNYSVTQTVDGCTSAASNVVVAAPKSTPAKPSVTVVNNCNGSSTLTITNAASGATFLWSNGSTENPITVESGGDYTVVQTVNLCPSLPSDAKTAAPKTTPAKPVVEVVNNCDGTSTLTATLAENASFAWSNGNTTDNPLVVNSPGSYSITQTLNGCASAPSDDATAAPKNKPATPNISVQDNCDGTSTLSTNAVGSLLWSTGETTSSISVNQPGIYTLTVTVNGCASDAGNNNANPKSKPAKADVEYIAPACTETTFSLKLKSAANGVTFTIKDKNGNDITGVLPGNSQNGTGADAMFTNIPAGSGYAISATQDGCDADAQEACGEATAPVALRSAEVNAAVKQTTAATKTVNVEFEEVPEISAYPNPFRDNINFRFVSPVSGQATLQIVNAQGQVLAVPFRGAVQAGIPSTINYRSTAAAGVMHYRLLVAGKTLHGKVIKQ